jgi:hypothetical protein
MGSSAHMPRVTLRTVVSADGTEDTITEYICDWPDCPNVAEHVVGVIRELRQFAAVCPEHARLLAERSKRATGH